LNLVAHALKVADTLTLPSDAVTQTFAFLARRGAGNHASRRPATSQLC